MWEKGINSTFSFFFQVAQQAYHWTYGEENMIHVVVQQTIYN